MMASLISSPSFACTFPHNKIKITSSRQTKFSCKASTADHEGRRNILISLAGTATATALTQQGSSTALASPVVTPDISDCHKTINADMPNRGCCPPAPPPNSRIIDFKPPPHTDPLKVRRPAHLLDKGYIEKYEEAVRLMKALPLDDPRNFLQQANVHCAYCDGAYEIFDKAAGSNFRLHVHNSWLFFPWHRLYLYFHERILGKLIGDETFALPFWNWDTPKGMSMPAIYNNRLSPLYDCYRDAAHRTPTTIDLDFGEKDDPKSPTRETLVDKNLNLMHRQMITAGSTARTFLGLPYQPGNAEGDTSGAGTIELVPHGPVHVWTGDPTRKFNADMGIFTLAARDPIFYAHHSNVDRLWSVWKTLGGKRKDFKDPDWLDSSFLFYDENKQLVRVTVKDSLDAETLRFTYQDVKNPWLHTPPKPHKTSATNKSLLRSKKVTTGSTTFPLTLNSNSSVTATVKRPKVSRTEKEKKEEEEVLVIEKIEVANDANIKFDVYINTLEHEGIGPESSEFAGSFVSLPHHVDQKKGKMKPTTTKLCLGLNEMLKDLEAEDDDSLLVTLVPRSGKAKIGGIKIEFFD